MLIICSSCNSKYLINSADLKPNGRKVKCAKCNHTWFQTSVIDNQESVNETIHLSDNDSNKVKSSSNINLPSTIVKEQKFSFINSLLVIFFTFVLIVIYFLFKSHGVNFFVFINYYILEFYFNLKMIINDLAKIIFTILN
tara:strand:+ start:589 stop:1008 length:420 start_codon:yes stop_codon:yes gene_type:complete